MFLRHYSNDAQIQGMDELLFCSYEKDDPTFNFIIHQNIENDISCLVNNLSFRNLRQTFRFSFFPIYCLDSNCLFSNESGSQHGPCIGRFRPQGHSVPSGSLLLMSSCKFLSLYVGGSTNKMSNSNNFYRILNS